MPTLVETPLKGEAPDFKALYVLKCDLMGCPFPETYVISSIDRARLAGVEHNKALHSKISDNCIRISVFDESTDQDI